MAIISCHNCGNSISSEASTCIHCNKPVSKKQEETIVNQPTPTYPYSSDQNTDVQIPSVGDWLIIFLLLLIPLVNIILLLVWAFSSDTNPVKANFSKAALLWIIILMGIYFIFFGAIIAAIFSAFSS
jgi:hypothetical protein